MDLGELITAFIAAIGVAVAALIGYAPLRAAMLELSFRPKLDIDVNGVRTSTVVYRAPLEDDHVLQTNFVINVRNLGRGTARDVEIALDISDALYRSDLNHTIKSEVAKIKKIEIGVDAIDGTKRALVAFVVPYLHGKRRISLSDQIFFSRNSELLVETDATSRDGVQILIGVQLALAYVLKLTVSAENVAPLFREYNVEFFRSGHANVMNLDADGGELAALLPKTDDRSQASKRLVAIFTFAKIEPYEIGGVKATDVWTAALRDARKSFAVKFDKIGYLPVRRVKISLLDFLVLKVRRKFRPGP